MIEQVTISTLDGKGCSVSYLEGEFERVRNIFYNNEYKLPGHKSHNGQQVVVDIGANVGMFALYQLMIEPDSKVYCFEPVKEIFDILKTNTQCYNGSVETFCYGLYDMDKQVDIYRYKNSGMSTINSKLFMSPQSSEKVWVKDAGKVFDELGIKHVDVLKIDTEGCEVQILESLGKRINKVDYIMAEYHQESDRRKMDDLLPNFTLVGITNCLIHPNLQLGVVKYMRNNFLEQASHEEDTL